MQASAIGAQQCGSSLGSSSGGSDGGVTPDCIDSSLMPMPQLGAQGMSPAHHGFNRNGVPPPPSYVQATVNAAREWNNTPPSEHESHATPPHTPELESSATSQYGHSTHSNSHTQQHPSAPLTVAPEGAYHTALFGQCEWIQPPPVPLVDQPTPAFPCYRLFLGQIRFETTPAEVKWIVQYVTGVQALKVESRGIGCFLAYFQTYDDMVTTQQLHKRILFDHSGIWFARTDEQSQAMQNYVRQALGRIGRGFRLPKDMMVVEEEKLQRALPIPNAPPQYGEGNNQQPNQQPNQQNSQPAYSSFHSGRLSNRLPNLYNNNQYGNHQQQCGGYSNNNNNNHGGYHNGNSAPFPSHQYTHQSHSNHRSQNQ
jgi:hypothetical protein